MTGGEGRRPDRRQAITPPLNQRAGRPNQNRTTGTVQATLRKTIHSEHLFASCPEERLDTLIHWMSFLNLKCMGFRQEGQHGTTQARGTITWEEARQNPPPPPQRTIAGQIVREELDRLPVLEIERLIDSPEQVHMFMEVPWPHNVELTDIGIFIARSVLSAAECGNLFPSTFDSNGHVRTTRIPKGPPVLARAFGITWIVTIDDRTILCGEELGKRFSWLVHIDRPPSPAATSSRFRAGQVILPDDFPMSLRRFTMRLSRICTRNISTEEGMTIARNNAFVDFVPHFNWHVLLFPSAENRHRGAEFHRMQDVPAFRVECGDPQHGPSEVADARGIDRHSELLGLPWQRSHWGPHRPSNEQLGPQTEGRNQDQQQPGPRREQRSQPGPSREQSAQPGPSREQRSQPGPSREQRSQPGSSREQRSQPGPSREQSAQPGPRREQRGPLPPGNGQSQPRPTQPGLNREQSARQSTPQSQHYQRRRLPWSATAPTVRPSTHPAQLQTQPTTQQRTRHQGSNNTLAYQNDAGGGPTEERLEEMLHSINTLITTVEEVTERRRSLSAQLQSPRGSVRTPFRSLFVTPPPTQRNEQDQPIPRFEQARQRHTQDSTWYVEDEEDEHGDLY